MVDEKLEFIEDDVSGAITLTAIAKADKFNNWMYTTIKPYCSSDVLEIGSGIGNISTFFLSDGFKIQLTDIRKGYCDRLQDQFGDSHNLLGIELMDLVDPEFDQKFSKFFGKFKTIFALNVVEHIHDDVLALKNCKKLLSEGGKVVILVPSYQWLFCRFDTELGHYRRYTKKSLCSVFEKAGYTIVDKKYFNFIGIFGWFVQGKLFRKKTISEGQMGLFNRLVPVFKIFDKLTFNSAGLSTIVCGEKRSTNSGN